MQLDSTESMGCGACSDGLNPLLRSRLEASSHLRSLQRLGHRLLDGAPTLRRRERTRPAGTVSHVAVRCLLACEADRWRMVLA